jgi:hypothetical protein
VVVENSAGNVITVRTDGSDASCRLAGLLLKRAGLGLLRLEILLWGTLPTITRYYGNFDIDMEGQYLFSDVAYAHSAAKATRSSH